MEHFDISNIKDIKGTPYVFFEEKNLLNSKDLLPENTVDNFPLRGKFVKLHIKTRRWTDKNSRQIVKRDNNLIARTSMTKDFCEVFKKISRYGSISL